MSRPPSWLLRGSSARSPMRLATPGPPPCALAPAAAAWLLGCRGGGCRAGETWLGWGNVVDGGVALVGAAFKEGRGGEGVARASLARASRTPWRRATTWWILGRCSGSVTSRSLMRPTSTGGLPGGSVYLPNRMDSLDSPSKGSLPYTSTYSSTPRAQMSTLVSMRCRVIRSHISGARYAGVVARLTLSSSIAISAGVSYTCALWVVLPKSHSTQRPAQFFSTFSAFRSRWAKGGDWLCICCTAWHTSENTS
mmetsp:Transcript_5023/g.13664  ORF Transcript_5023/g.13664 Transcript_5023/m.13664 type:complete len:252 (-) Transcript_5023:457-1212(-)